MAFHVDGAKRAKREHAKRQPKPGAKAETLSAGRFYLAIKTQANTKAKAESV